MSDCYLYQSEIDGAAEGGELGRAARAHVAACRACGGELRARESLRALVRGLDRVEAPADFEFRLRARMAGGERAGGRRGPFRGLRLAYAFAPVAAAACFLVVSAALYYRQAARTGAVRPAASAVEPARGGAAAGVATGAEVEVARAPEGGDAPPVADKNDAAGNHAASPSKRAAVVTRQAASVASRGERSLRAARETRLYGVNTARVVRPQGVTFAVKTQSEPLRMILRDERGGGRVVPMRAVSFGSQELIARESTLRQKAGVGNEGVW